jgi:hypothetical protein
MYKSYTRSFHLEAPSTVIDLSDSEYYTLGWNVSLMLWLMQEKEFRKVIPVCLHLSELWSRQLLTFCHIFQPNWLRCTVNCRTLWNKMRGAETWESDCALIQGPDQGLTPCSVFRRLMCTQRKVKLHAGQKKVKILAAFLQCNFETESL